GDRGESESVICRPVVGGGGVGLYPPQKIKPHNLTKIFKTKHQQASKKLFTKNTKKKKKKTKIIKKKNKTTKKKKQNFYTPIFF
ncbi:hypothetical protein, partial [Enterobacter intestinihominis]